MDLATLDTTAVESVPMRLKHPGTGQVLDTVLHVVGVDSDRYREKARQISNRRINSKQKRMLTIEEVEADNDSLLVSCIVGWDNVTIDGEKVEFSLESAKKLIQRFRWIREQIDEFVGDRANFLPNA